MSNEKPKRHHLIRNTATPFSYRPAPHLAPRFYDVVEVSKRSKASIVHESLEKTLPTLELQHAPELQALKRSRKKQNHKTLEAKAA